MTQEEAKLFFTYEDGDDLTDLYDERLFEYKQFFLSKTPIHKVFLSKLEKLRQMDRAYQSLVGNSYEEFSSVVSSPISFSNVIREAFTQWEHAKGICKQQLMMAQDAKALHLAVENYLSVVAEYRQKWYTDQEIDLEISQVSKDEDPMEVLGAIRAFEEAGGKNFEDLLKLNNNSFLLKEMKRLSLLIKNYGNGRSF
jgi:hypothetical protein